ncbi:MAG: hypothetical protein WDN04_10370 [Rhodospirillales bacterium]
MDADPPHLAAAPPGVTLRTTAAVREVLAGRRRGLPAILALSGPAVVASVAYVDPGNFATTSSPAPPTATRCSGSFWPRT